MRPKIQLPLPTCLSVIQRSDGMTAQEFGKEMGISFYVAQRHLEELCLLGYAEKHGSVYIPRRQIISESQIVKREIEFPTLKPIDTVILYAAVAGKGKATISEIQAAGRTLIAAGLVGINDISYYQVYDRIKYLESHRLIIKVARKPIVIKIRPDIYDQVVLMISAWTEILKRL